MSQQYDFTIEQGATLAKTITLKLDGAVFDLTDYEARLQARCRDYDTDTVLSLTSDPPAGFTIQAENGIILMEMLPEETEALGFISARYNLELYTAADTVVLRVLKGNIMLSKEYAK